LRMMQRTSTTDARKHGELWKSYPGPSFAVKAPLIHDDSLKRGEFAPRSFITPQISAEERRRRASTTKDTRSTSVSQGQKRLGQAKDHTELREVFILPRVPEVEAERNWPANQREEICFMEEVAAFTHIRGWPHGPPARARAA